MKKKVVLSVFSGLILITAILLVALFSAPIFYNTKYDVIDNDRLLVGTVEFGKDGIATMIGNRDTGFDVDFTQKYLISNGKIYLLDNSSGGTTFSSDTFQIKSKFSIVASDCTLTPCGGGVTAFLLLIITNAVAVVVVAGITLSYFIKKHNKNRGNVA